MNKLLVSLFGLLFICACSQEEPSLSNLNKSEAFLSMNIDKDGVNRVESGLQYKVLQTGDVTGFRPSLENTVTAHFHGTLIDGEVFWSSVDTNEPLVINLSQLIVGCQKVMSLMRPGDKWRVFIHPNMAYGQEGRPGIPSNSLLIFDIELLEVS